MLVPIILFTLAAGVLIFLIWAIWRFWWRYAQITPENEEFEERLADLNQHQANRISDEQLTHPATDDQAWQIMVQRGKTQRTQRKRRS